MFGSTEFEHFSVAGNDLYLGLTGIGKVQAAMNLTSLLAKEKIDLVIMTGSAGSLQKEVQRMDLVLPTNSPTTMPTTLQRATMSKDRSRRNRPALSWTARKETSSRTFWAKRAWPTRKAWS